MYYLKRLVQIKKQNKKIVLVGMGQENRQFLAWLLKDTGFLPKNIVLLDQGLDSTKFLSLFKEEQDIELSQDLPKENMVFGTSCFDFFANEGKLVDLGWVFKAPGIWSLRSEFVSLRQKFGEDFVTSGLVFFLERYRQNIIGITGTKGKTTTSSMLTHLLKCHIGQNSIERVDQDQNTIQNKAVHVDKKSGIQEVYYCGNTTGISPYKYWEKLDFEDDSYFGDNSSYHIADNQNTSQIIESVESLENSKLQTSKASRLNKIFVVELSSFQLQDLGFAKISPKYSIITNYFVDHLDQHGSVDEYWHAKDQIFSHQKAGDYFLAYKQIWDNIEIRKDKLKQAKMSPEFDSDYPDKTFQIGQNFFDLDTLYTSNLAGLHNFQNLVLCLVCLGIVVLEFEGDTNLGNFKASSNLENKTKGQRVELLEVIDYLKQNQTKIQESINSFQSVEYRLEKFYQLSVFDNQNPTGLNLDAQSLNAEDLNRQSYDKPTPNTLNFYDDGASTQPESTAAAVQSLTQNQGLVLFITGKDKGGQMQILVNTINSCKNNILRIYACSEVGAVFLKTLEKISLGEISLGLDSEQRGGQISKQQTVQQDSSNGFSTDSSDFVVENGHQKTLSKEDIEGLKSKIVYYKLFKDAVADFKDQFAQASFLGFLKTDGLSSDSNKNQTHQETANKKLENVGTDNKNQFLKSFEASGDNLFSNTNFEVLNICLSPAGSSFDEFENYKQRSKFWKESMLSLK